MQKHVLLIAFSILAFGGTSFAQQDVPRIVTPITLDGVVSDEEWGNVPMLPLMVFSPVLNGEPSESTEMYMAYDDDYLYLAGRMHHTDLNDILAASNKRDAFEYGLCSFGVMLDTFNDNENALGFFTTANGTRTDFSVFNDANGEFPMNSSWNTFWDAEATRDENGWYGEMRIPFSSLRFEDTGEDVVMGITYWRYMAGKNENLYTPGLSNEYGPWSAFKPSQAKKFKFKGLKSKKPIYVAPYLLGGTTSTAALNSEESAYGIDTDNTGNIGLDVKYSLSSNLTLDLTLNTDFAQVEADNQQVNLTRFSLFFPEKRLFFQERSSVFNFQLGGPATLFYSRKIGFETVDDELTTTRIYGGGRLVGRIGKWDVGLIDMQTEQVDSIATTNHGVVRLRRQVINDRSFIGGMFTSKQSADGNYNRGVGIDGIIRVIGTDYFQFGYAETYYNGMENKLFSVDQAKLFLKWRKQQEQGLGYDFGLSRVGENYDPALGFESRDNYTRFGNSIWYGWLPESDSRLYQHKFSLDGSAYVRNGDKVTESADIGFEYNYGMRNSADGQGSLKYYYENVPDTFDLSDDVEVPAGVYDYYGLEATIWTPRTNKFAAGVNTYLGSFYDGKRLTLGVNSTVKVSALVNFEFNYEFNAIDFKARNQQFLGHVGGLKYEAFFNSKLSALVFAQFNSSGYFSLANFRLRYNPKEGTDLYFVYNEGWNTNRSRDLPDLPIMPVTENRAFILKYTYTFAFGG